MYTHVEVRSEDRPGPARQGHLYDISEGGLRFELDEPLDEGERIRIEIGLPGCRRLIEAYGKVVRINDAEDDPGPRRMALMFDRFADESSRTALSSYLNQRWLEEERAA
jgi:c-di-GMP-binding flagellar brake protein YcgR